MNPKKDLYAEDSDFETNFDLEFSDPVLSFMRTLRIFAQFGRHMKYFQLFCSKSETDLTYRNIITVFV